MAAADTNLLVRLLQRDDPAQLRKAMAFLERNAPLWISGAVLTETVWVLMSVYAWDKPKLLAMLQAAMESKDFAFQDQAAVQARYGFSQRCKPASWIAWPWSWPRLMESHPSLPLTR